MYGLSDTGWMDSEIFLNWFTHHFLVHAPSSRPLLLLLDGHSTHYNPEFVKRAAYEQVLVFCFPPNTTHLTQPLDKGVFGPLKTYWHQECQEYMAKNPGKVVTQFDFMAVFSKAWYRAMTMPNIMAAFRTTGIHPFNRRSIAIDEVTPSQSLAEKTGLAFIPFYTPMRKSKSALKSDASTKDDVQDLEFTEEEQARFIRRLQEGYDITSDARYNLWLKKYSAPTETSQNDSGTMPASDHETPQSNLLIGKTLKPRSLVRQFLPNPPQTRKPQSYEKKTSKVLTSAEHRKEIEEKERQKREKLEEKEKRKQQRELQKIKRQQEKEKKKQQQKRMVSGN